MFPSDHNVIVFIFYVYKLQKLNLAYLPAFDSRLFGFFFICVAKKEMH